MYVDTEWLRRRICGRGSVFSLRIFSRHTHIPVFEGFQEWKRECPYKNHGNLGNSISAPILKHV